MISSCPSVACRRPHDQPARARSTYLLGRKGRANGPATTHTHTHAAGMSDGSFFFHRWPPDPQRSRHHWPATRRRETMRQRHEPAKWARQQPGASPLRCWPAGCVRVAHPMSDTHHHPARLPGRRFGRKCCLSRLFLFFRIGFIVLNKRQTPKGFGGALARGHIWRRPWRANGAAVAQSAAIGGGRRRGQRVWRNGPQTLYSQVPPQRDSSPRPGAQN